MVRENTFCYMVRQLTAVSFVVLQYKTEPALKLYKKNTHLEKTNMCEYFSKRIPVPCELCCCVSFDLCESEKWMSM